MGIQVSVHHFLDKFYENLRQIVINHIGNKGHWSCCMNEDRDSCCNKSHTGFWHMACVDKRCTSKICYCNSCGGGCTYEGFKGHWSCCNSEDFGGKCINSPYTNLDKNNDKIEDKMNIQKEIVHNNKTLTDRCIIM